MVMVDPERPAEKADGLTIMSELLGLVTLLAGGAFLGERLARYVAPQHALMQLAGLVMLPLALVFGLTIWLGLGLAREIWSGAKEGPRHAFRWRRPKGALLLLPMTLAVSIGMAFAACNCSSFAAHYVFNLYLAVGTLYGLTSWLFAQWGFFDFWKWLSD